MKIFRTDSATGFKNWIDLVVKPVCIFMIAVPAWAQNFKYEWGYHTKGLDRDRAACLKVTPEGFLIQTVDLAVCHKHIGGAYVNWNKEQVVYCAMWSPPGHLLYHIEHSECERLKGYQIYWIKGSDHHAKCVKSTPDGRSYGGSQPNSVCETGKLGLQPSQTDVKKAVVTPQPQTKTLSPKELWENHRRHLKTLNQQFKFRPLYGAPIDIKKAFLAKRQNFTDSGVLKSQIHAVPALIEEYLSAIENINTVSSAVTSPEDKRRMGFLLGAFKSASTILHVPKILPVTHWRVRESARRVVVMGRIAKSVLEDLDAIKGVADPDPIKQEVVQKFVKSLAGVREILGEIEEIFGYKTYFGDPSRGAAPLVSLVKIQLDQVKKSLGSVRDPDSKEPVFQEFFGLMEEVIDDVQKSEVTDTSHQLAAKVKTMSEIWNQSGSRGAALVARALMADSVTAVDAKLLYICLSALGNMFGNITFGAETSSMTLQDSLR